MSMNNTMRAGWGGVYFSFVSKSLPTRWEEPFPSSPDPRKTHLSSPSPLHNTRHAQHRHNIRNLTQATLGPQKEHISGTWQNTLHFTSTYQTASFARRLNVNAPSSADAGNTDPFNNAGNDA